MRSKERKLTLYLLVALLTIFLCLGEVNAADYTNYFGIEMTNQQYSNLLNQGFQENEIYYMNEETFNENKDLTASLEAVTSKYYKSIYNDLYGNPQVVEISESEYENAPTTQMRGFVETEYKRMETSVSKIDNTYYRYKVTTRWKQMPSVRSYDIIGLAYEEDAEISISGLVNFQFNYCESTGACYADGTFYDKRKNFNGGSAVYKFPSSAITMTATLYFNVVKNTTNTVTEQTVHGDYAHALSNVDYAIYSNHTMGTGGLALGNSSPYYDNIPCADSYWTGTW